MPSSKRHDFLSRMTGGDEKEISFLERMIVAHEAPTGPLDGGFLSVDPEQIGPYRVEGRLGEGGMGVVYVGVHTKLDRRVAVKVLAPGLARDPDRILRFHREAKILAKLDHPHIATVYDFDEDNGRYFVAMQLIDGPTLAEHLSGGPLPLTEALELLIGIAEGLVEAHAHGIVHRDLKPQNVLIHPTQGAKIVDFGIATSLGDTERPTKETGDAVTDTTAIGTWEYASPEQRRRSAADERSDIWSFGCLAYECVTGKRAFPPRGGPSIQEPDWEFVPPGMKTLIEGCLRPEREDRWQRMSDVLEQLLTLRRELRGNPDLRSDSEPFASGSTEQGPGPLGGSGYADVESRPSDRTSGHGPSAPFSNHPGRAIRYAALAAVVTAVIAVIGWNLLRQPTLPAVVERQSANVLKALDAKDQTLWIRTVEGEIMPNLTYGDSPAVVPFVFLQGARGPNGVIVSIAENGAPGRLLDLDPKDGSTLWETELSWTRPQNKTETGHEFSTWQRAIRVPEPESSTALLISIRNGPWYQDSVHKLSLEGETLASYYHPGLILPAGQFSFGDSIQDAVLLFGDNSSARFDRRLVPFDTDRHCGAALLLDPAHIDGQAFPYSPGTDRDWPGIPPATEIAYLAIPPIHPEEDAAVEEFQVDTVAGTITLRCADGRMFSTDARLRPRSVFIPSDCVAHDRIEAGEATNIPVLYIQGGVEEYLAVPQDTEESVTLGAIELVEKVNESTLAAYDGRGHRVWIKSFAGAISYPRLLRSEGEPRLVLVSVARGDEQELTALNLGGEELWTRKATFAPSESAEGPFRYTESRLVDWGDRESIVSTVIAGSWYQCAFQSIDPASGELLGAYYHPGHLKFEREIGGFGDSSRRLLLYGSNNSARYDSELVPFETKYHCGTVVLLGQDDFHGQAFPYSSLPGRDDWSDLEHATERAYLAVAPFSEDSDATVTSLTLAPRGVGGEMRIEARLEDGRIVMLDENLEPESVHLILDQKAEVANRSRPVESRFVHAVDGVMTRLALPEGALGGTK
ncbi:MAG: serine/threonine protein kinase [Candidatus Eisenbacteria bacterium]|nr:serine/threonine protein kinase [Candidatus Eisenbacteria bacterium]